MLKHLRRHRPKPQTVDRPSCPEGFLPVLDVQTLLATPHRKHLIQRLWQLTALSDSQYQRLYLGPIQQYARWVQQLPASENHHHAYLGGLLDHGLELVAYSLKLRQSHLLPVGSAPEDQAAQADAWSAGIAYAALLHDIGKIAVDLHIETADQTTWHPWHGPLQQPYRFRYVKGRDYHLHGAAAGLIHQQILTTQHLDWLSQYPELWRALLYQLAGHHADSGILGELVLQADRLSTAQNLGGNPAKVLDAPQTSLQQHLLQGLRYLLEHELKLNQPGAAGWLTEDSLWLVSKVVIDKLRAYLLSQGIEGVPTSNVRVFDELQAHRLIVPTHDDKAIWSAEVTDGDWQQRFTFIRLSPSLIWHNDERPTPFTGTVIEKLESPESESNVPTSQQTQPKIEQPHPHATPDTSSSIPSTEETNLEDNTSQDNEKPAEQFLAWLKEGIRSHKLLINDTAAKIHTVNGKVLLVTPGIFQRYILEFPDRLQGIGGNNERWKYLQQQFGYLKLHQKCPDGLNVWSCTVQGPRKQSQLKGYLLKDPSLLFVTTPPDNPFIKLLEN
ncbi:MobH family relaxase [Pseudomonas sp. LRF_L74]|uniref:MobH family relaxase n=1 Tax=Pseudomonas sp. LRF_L74 TaxID=3369422 RepID=UPI003F6027A8